MSFTRRHLIRSAAALGLTLPATSLRADIDKTICDLERTHRDWRLALRMRAKYTEDNRPEGIAFYLKLEHRPSSLTLNLRTGKPDALFRSLNRGYVPLVTYADRDILQLFNAKNHPDGRSPVTTFLLIKNPDTNVEKYVIWDYEPEAGECGVYSYDGCLKKEAGDNPKSTYGWTKKRRTPDGEAKAVFPLLFKTNRPKVYIGHHDQKADTWPHLVSYNLDTTGLEDAVGALIDEGNAQLSGRDLSTCGTPGDSEPCFLTTACCAHMGRSDDCTELQTLRRFRDEWLARHPDGAALITEYYRAAPRICAAIARDPKGARRLQALYWATILPCVAAIKLGANGLAFHLYGRMMRRLQARYPSA